MGWGKGTVQDNMIGTVCREQQKRTGMKHTHFKRDRETFHVFLEAVWLLWTGLFFFSSLQCKEETKKSNMLGLFLLPFLPSTTDRDINTGKVLKVPLSYPE